MIADGSGSAANFSTLTLTEDVTVTLDGPRTIGSLTFDDQGSTKHNWLLEAGSSGPLTLAGATPTVTVLSGTTTFNLVVAGTAGLTKAGAGNMVLAGDNTYTGSTTIDAGTLAFGSTAFAAAYPLNIAGGSAVAESSETLNLAVNSTGTAMDVSGPGTLRLVGTANGPATPDLYFGPNHSANSCWGARLASPVDLGSSQRYVYGKTGHNGVGRYGLEGADCQLDGPISGSGGVTFIAQNSWTASEPMEASFALNAANTFTGPLEIRRGSIYLGNAGALSGGNVLRFNPAAGNNARLFLYGHNASVSDLSFSGAGSAVIANGNLKTGGMVTLGAVTLDVTQNGDATFGGVIADTWFEYSGSGSGTTGPLNLRKAGSARLRLTGASTYTGTTVISGGTLQIDGSLGPGMVTVQGGAVLTGTGTLNGPVSIQNCATLAPGDEGIGTFTVNQNLNLAGVTVMKLSKTGTALACDQVAGIRSLSYGGSLVVTNIGDVRTGALSAGDSFRLFVATAYNGSLSNATLPALSPGLAWDTANLGVDGSITVVSETGAPVITSQPASVAVSEGSAVQLTVIAAGPRPLNYQWRKDGVDIASAIDAAYGVASASTNDAGGYSVVVTNSYGSTTSVVAKLTVLPPGQGGVLTNGLMVYLDFDNNLDAQAGTTNSGTLYTGGAQNGPRYLPGIIGSAVNFANHSTGGQPDDWAISLGSLEWIYAGDFTVSLWERATTSGDGALMGNKNWTSGANVGWVISSFDPKNVNYNAVGGTRRDVDLNPPFSDGAWHLVTVSFNRAANEVMSYIDGVAVNTSDISPSGGASLNAGFATLVGSSGNGTYSGAGDIDDLGVWNRVLTPEEVAGIYGAGLSGKPLTAAVPGESPAVTAQPLDMNVAAGNGVTFSVTAAGPGTLSYQWRFNGTDIAGATNSTLTLASVSTASRGVYTVLVSNGSGAVLSAGAVLSVYTLSVTGQWDFDRGGLQATVGADLEYRGATAGLTTFPLANIQGQAARVLAFGSNSPAQGFLMRHGAKPNGGGHFVNQYTLIMDVMFPVSSTGRWRALFQTDPFNQEDNEAEFLIGSDAASPDPNGIGAEDQYDGSLAADTWYRIAFAVDLTAAPGQELAKYVNGVKVGTQSLSGGVDGRFALGPTALLLTAGNAQGGVTAPGLVNSVQFLNGCLGPEAIAALGGPNAIGLPPGNAVLRIEGISQNASMMTLTWTGPDAPTQLQRAVSLTNPVWENIGGFTSNGSITLPIAGPTAFYRVEQFRPDIQVGQLPNSEQSLPSKQILRPAGQRVEFGGRPVDLVLSPDGRTVYIKNLNNLLVLDAGTWAIRQTLNYPGSGASMHGIAVAPDGSRIYVTGCGNELYEWSVATNGTVSFSRTISLPGGSDPCGVAVSADGTRAYVCLSIANNLAVVDLVSGTVLQQIRVGIAPWDVVLSPDGTTAYVSDWGGRFPAAGDLTASSAGTPVVVDERGVGASGVVSLVNLGTGLETVQVPTGLHPSDMELSSDGYTLYVANANSDTVTVIDTQSAAVKETILVRPDSSFPYGSAGNGLALSQDAKNLFLACGGNNAIALVELPSPQHTNSVVQGFLPTDWYPGAVVTGGNELYLVNVKGLGSRAGQPATTTWQIGAFLGTAIKIPIPSLDTLAKYTSLAYEQGRVTQVREALLPALGGQPPVPVPARAGDPSVFQHVLYILKENKTYDQMFGDIAGANGSSGLCIYPEFVSPNHHALAKEFVLLDNYYCNGVNSADGHSWSTEANDTDHLEKSFGGFVRSYTFGDDALTYSSTGFIWNNVLEHGLTFRNYGEMDYASTSPSATWSQIYTDYLNHTHAIRYVQNIGIASLVPYSSTNVPGWNVGIPDVVRAEGFIKELNEAQTMGSWAAFHLLYLPNDHTGGPPSSRAQVADNDLALGQVVEAVSKSIFWTNTVIFVIEDDPQSGYDHVDGHRSICLVISPYTKRREVVSTFYNQAGVLHTMERILGLPPMNQQDAMAPLMFDCFTNVPDFTPYTALANNVPLTEGVASSSALSSKERYWARKIQKLDFSRPDRINDDLFNRYIWFTIKGDAPYPAEFVGGHGKGLKQLGLVLDKAQEGDDDD